METKVTIQRRPISKGRDTLILAYYPPLVDPLTYKSIKSESMGIYVYQEPKNKFERNYNKETLFRAELIRCKRFQDIIDDKYNYYDKTRATMDFLEYFRDKAKRKNQKWGATYNYFEEYTCGVCCYGDVTLKLCQDFREYLLNAKQIKNSKVKVKHNSAAGYYSTFIALMREAKRDRVISTSIADQLDRIPWEETKREFLTIEEVQHLSQTSCDIPVLKAASLFACLTGLRLNDIIDLEWSNILPRSNGGYSLRFQVGKNKSQSTLPLSDDAYELCGERGEGRVFKGFERSMAQYPLKNWLKEAGIERNVSFHCFRHTFATLQLTLGTDIYTVSQMLSHRYVTTTQIYAKIVDSKKIEAANRITLKNNPQDD